MNHNISYETKIDDNFEIPVKKLALNRALKNLINNGLNHANKVYLNTYLSQNNLIIEVEDLIDTF